MEVLNDILGYDLKIYQDNSFFCFSIDSIVLANFCRIRKRCKKILDLGCGNGVIPLVLSLRTNAIIDGVEIQSDLADMACRSILYNKKDRQIKIYNQDMKDFCCSTRYNSYDMVVCNPPYFKNNEKSIKNLDIHKVIARHEVMIKLEDIFFISFQLLKEGGVFATVNRVERFMEIMELFKKYKIEPKYIRFVYDNIEVGPSLFYIEGIKCGKIGLYIDRPFIMYDIDKKETCEYKKLKLEVNDAEKL